MSHTTFNTNKPVNETEVRNTINAANDSLAKGDLTIKPGSESVSTD